MADDGRTTPAEYSNVEKELPSANSPDEQIDKHSLGKKCLIPICSACNKYPKL